MSLGCFLFEPEVLFLSLLEQRTEEDRRFRWEGGHVGGKGVLGEHREITADLLVALDGRDRARGGLATCTRRRRRE